MSPPGAQPALIEDLMASRIGAYTHHIQQTLIFAILQMKLRFREAGKSEGRFRRLISLEMVKG